MVKAPKPVKVYVGVDVAFDDSGRMHPRVIHWEDGSRYKIDRVLDVRPAPAARRRTGRQVQDTVAGEGDVLGNIYLFRAQCGLQQSDTRALVR